MTCALLVGGGSEIGLAILTEFAKLNTVNDVILIGRKGRSMDLAAKYLDETFPTIRAHLVYCDLSNPSLTAATVREAVTAHSPTISVLAAGVNQISVDSASAAEMGLVNYVSMCVAGEEILKNSSVTAESWLLVLSSIAGSRPRITNYLYGSSKAALDFWARGAISKYRGQSKILLIRLGKVSTRSSQVHPWAPLTKTPDFIGRRTARMTNGRSRVIWIPRSMGLLSFALRLLPRRLWRQLSQLQAR